VHRFVATLSYNSVCWVLTLFVVLTGTASATLTVNVISPSINEFTGTASGGTPVFYEAYATNPECAAGISAMRIYTNPGVDAYAVNGGHLETFISLPLGTYATVVQAWDNCGAVAKTAVPLNVTRGNITVYLPSASVTYAPVHIAASSQTGCSKGISAMRLYTEPYAGVYTVDSNALDAFVTVPPGNYNMTVVAWDNCGGVFTSGIASAVTGAPDGYLYGTYGTGNEVAELQVGGAGELINPNGTANPPLTSVPGVNSMVVDPGGWFLYASGTKGIYAFQIDPVNGSLVPIAGSPFAGTGITQLVAEPSGNFIYALSSSTATYRINRSNGALTATGQSVEVPPGGFPIGVDGPFLYSLGGSDSTVQVFGYALNDNNGALTSIAGLPITLPDTQGEGSGSGMATADYRLFVFNEIPGDVWSYDINVGSGALTAAPGSPYTSELNFGGLVADWEGRYLWIFEFATTATNNSDNTFDVSSTGQVTSTSFAGGGGAVGFGGFTEDLTGNYIFTEWTNAVLPPTAAGGKAVPQPGGNDVGVQSFYLSDGAMENDTYTVLPNMFYMGAIARQDPN
jgi:hypothetical protein